MTLSTADWVVIGVAVFNTIIVPGSVLAAKSMMERTADERAASVKGELHEHLDDDKRNFQILHDMVAKLDEKRTEQHTQNRELLTKLSTSLEWLKLAILHHEE